jgi:hypothetical protein
MIAVPTPDQNPSSIQPTTKQSKVSSATMPSRIQKIILLLLVLVAPYCHKENISGVLSSERLLKDSAKKKERDSDSASKVSSGLPDHCPPSAVRQLSIEQGPMLHTWRA